MGQAEVAHFHGAIGVDEAIRRLNVTMQHARRLCGIQPANDVHYRGNGIFGRHRTVGSHPLFQRPSRK
jgi:hypothetical protein